MLKDQILENLAASGSNVAQFISFDPQGNQRFARIRNINSGYQFVSIEEAVRAIHATQTNKNVNIRTFLPDKPDGNPFLYGPKCGFNDPENVAVKARGFLEKGYYLIINETIDEADGGFSGVIMGDIFEFASRDIPRCVEKPGCAALPRKVALDLIKTVYGFDFKIPYDSKYRVECSVHPAPVGYLGEQQIVWQAEELSDPGSLPRAPKIFWPNRYSRDMGDKAFGLLIAHLLGLPVPFTHVSGRVVPYFNFGTKPEKRDGLWVRTCPQEQQPGRFSTFHCFSHPFQLLQSDSVKEQIASVLAKEDPDKNLLYAALVQEGIKAEYSGAAITDANGKLVIEGKSGSGDIFMIGEAAAEKIPSSVVDSISNLWTELRQKLGDVRFEWVYDGERAWLVQLHVGKSASSGDTIYPGEPATFWEFKAKNGLEKLYELCPKAKAENAGIVLVGNVNITCHLCDILRREKIPSRRKFVAEEPVPVALPAPAPQKTELVTKPDDPNEKMIQEAIKNSLMAVLCITGSSSERSRTVYASSPLTTGPRMYAKFKEHAVKSVDELKRIDPDFFTKDVLGLNIADGENFAAQLRKVDNYRYVISPAPFFAKYWTQKHYMAFWKQIIEQFADDIRFHDGWWLSNGCVEEFLIGLQSNKGLYEGTDTKPIISRNVMEKIAAAIEEIEKLGADASKLKLLYSEIQKLLN